MKKRKAPLLDLTLTTINTDKVDAKELVKRLRKFRSFEAALKRKRETGQMSYNNRRKVYGYTCQ
jgi:hypothetical protein